MLNFSELQADAAESQLAARLEEFVALFFKTQRRLHYYIFSLVPNAHDADDVLQETALVLWKKFGEYEPNSDFYAWACRIAYLQVLHVRRTKARSREVLDQDVLDQIAEETVSVAQDSETQLAALAGCLEKLPPRDRELIKGRYDLNQNMRELGEKIGAAPNTVCKTLGRIRLALLKCIQRETGIQGKTLAAEGGEG